MRLAVLGIALALGMTAAAAQAGNITPHAWKTFLNESSARYSDADPDDFEYQLYQAAKKNPAPDKAIADFARRIKADPAQARDYAELLVDVVGYFKACDSSCAFHPGVPIYGEAARVGLGEPTGRLLEGVAEDVPDSNGEANAVDVIRLAWRHPQAASILLKLYAYDGKSYNLAAALVKLPNDPATPPPALTGDRFSNAPDETSGLVPAIIEATEARLADTRTGRAWHAALAQWALAQDLSMGLTQEAVTRYLAYPAFVHDQIPYAPAGLSMTDRCNLASDSFDLTDDLAAALWLEGHQAEAQALLAHSYPDGWRRNPTAQADFDMVGDVFQPTIADRDLFKLYIEGRTPEKTWAAKAETCGRTFSGGLGGGEGWLFAARTRPPALRHLVAGRLSTAGYKDMAAWLDSQPVFWSGDRQQAVLALLAGDLPADARARQAAWRERISLAQARDPADAPASGPIHVTKSQLPDIWAEHPLPADIKPWRDADKAAGIPKGTKLPVPVDSVLRYEADGGDAAMVYESSEYDLSGETPAGGLWLALRRGSAWQKPIYLGLQSHFPYEVTAGSRLPMIKGGRLQLEVRVREIDPDTITFPPVALGYKRQADGLYLDASLDALSADTDKDGLTDIEEARLGLKPDNVDSDGDGIPDGADPLPLTPYNPKADPRETAVAKIILENLIGHDAGAHIVTPQPAGASDEQKIDAAIGKPAPLTKRSTLFVVSDRDIFSGILDAPFRLIVYSNADLERLDRTKAPFYPPRVTELFVSLDGADYYVNWSAGWVGGSFLVHCEGTHCTSTQLGGWIT